MAALYQPFFKREASQSAERKRLATLVTPRWGFVLQLVSILTKLEFMTIDVPIHGHLFEKSIYGIRKTWPQGLRRKTTHSM